VALIPVTRSLPGEVERLFPTNEAFRGSRNNFKLVALDGGEVSRLGGKRFADHGEALAEGLIDEKGSDDGSVGDVFNRGSLGWGTGRGLRNLSSGFIVLNSETAELVLAFLGRPLARLKGTCRTLTSWPGSSGQDVVDGSAEL
jgi:hypothetical protein